MVNAKPDLSKRDYGMHLMIEDHKPWSVKINVRTGKIQSHIPSLHNHKIIPKMRLNEEKRTLFSTT